MTSRLLRAVVPIFGFALARPASAIDASFYTYNGFSETVDAFRLVAMIFADPRYETLVVIIAVVGISLGALLASIRGQAMGLVAFGFQMLVGVGLFVGMITTTGTVHVYDKVRNAYQAVGDVPNLLVLVAGTTNLVERALVETIDDNLLDPTSKVEFGAGGHMFDLFFNAVAPRGPMTDTFLDATIKDYVRQCYPVARVSAAYGVDDDRLFRTATDLPAAFAAMSGPATFSTVYTAADKGGTTVSCADAWSHISERLSDPVLFDAYSSQVCRRSGFDVTQAVQLTRCRAQIGEIGQTMMGTPLSLQALMGNILLGNSVGDVLFEDSPASAARVMANRAVLSSGLATMSVANEWLPTIRAVVFGIMLFMVPVALLFILTPINLRVAGFALGLFVFVALWGVIDAGIYQLTLGRAMGALSEMRANAVAANAWLLAPSSAQKALAIFGSFRTAAAGLAGAFVFTVFRFSGNIFSAVTGGALGVSGQASEAAAPLATGEGYASALEAQGSAVGTFARRAAASSFGDFGERSSFARNRGFGAADGYLSERASAVPGVPAFGMGGIDAARELGGLAPALTNGDLSHPATRDAIRANATTSALHQFAEKDALRSLGTRYFGNGPSGERAFASFSQNLIQWRAFGDTRAYGMMMDGVARYFERAGYSEDDAQLKASGVIADASADPTFAKLIANAFDQNGMLANDLTAAQVQAGAMAGRRDHAGDAIASVERGNVATEQAHRTGGNAGQRDAAAMLGLSVGETSRRIAFINALSGEARSTAISQLGRATGRDEARVMRALETFNAATQIGTADGVTAEAARERTTIYGRTRETAGYDLADRAGKLDAQREIEHDGVRQAARIREQRQESNEAGFAHGARAAGTSVREAAHLDAFIGALRSTAGNQVDIAEGGATGIADRARNDRLSQVVGSERLTRAQGLLRNAGVTLSKRQIAMDQDGDFHLNLNPRSAAQMWRAGLINESQLGAIANGGTARFSFAHDDLLVSSSTGFERSARSDTSTRFEAGKQAGPDTIEHFLGGGADGQAEMANWLRGGFEMDRKGRWRLKPQVADTLQRDVQAIMVQTGWSRTLTRSADDTNSVGTDISATVSADARRGGFSKGASQGQFGARGGAGGSFSIVTSDRGATSESTSSALDIVNYDVRAVISNAERAAARSSNPTSIFTKELAEQIIGTRGLRNRYLNDADSGRGTADVTSPITSIEQRSVLASGRFSNDLANGPFDGDSEFKERR
ncbi:conjugal transfer protein TraG [Sphingomonas sp. AP4-R1]|uniref:conjugal transfer protein TraG N-terminal domain-containing protein n=1 Tax=Sphingomonas sp. AP4-R1 TaxID=2735134 RepID=UPI001493C658|nr:conjugal transfer protein TraG N-terminal domain-containing protein [Sphingomonas sp. AP4-R1]QJU59271.1 conjugal transfer protein TraG [Sphingomonas sp. AP4-R1]